MCFRASLVTYRSVALGGAFQERDLGTTIPVFRDTDDRRIEVVFAF